ncbi:hypothetical protein E4U32_005980 [Claviceps aff. humidiphila group G2b]|nr:hypothetical protein E4U32_005980 [Claviceps aff. humidiphila group G2b]
MPTKITPRTSRFSMAPHIDRSSLYSRWMTEVHDEAKKQPNRSRQQMKDWADKRRVEPPTSEEGDLVMFNARNIRTKLPAKKLDKKMLGS